MNGRQSGGDNSCHDAADRVICWCYRILFPRWVAYRFVRSS